MFCWFSTYSRVVTNTEWEQQDLFSQQDTMKQSLFFWCWGHGRLYWFKSTMNLGPERDLILNLKPPVLMLRREKHCLILLLQSQSKATAKRETDVRKRTTYHQHQFYEKEGKMECSSDAARWVRVAGREKKMTKGSSEVREERL